MRRVCPCGSAARQSVKVPPVSTQTRQYGSEASTAGVLTGRSYWPGESASSYLWSFASTDAASVPVMSRTLLRFLSPRMRDTARGARPSDLAMNLSRALFAAESTGGAVMRTLSCSASASETISSREARGWRRMWSVTPWVVSRMYMGSVTRGSHLRS